MLRFLIAVAVSTLLIGCSESPEDIAKREARAAEHRAKGFHCLSGWDGSHIKLVAQVKRQLRDPDSFEHIETRVSRVKEGKHNVIMQYRARNGFGGMNATTARGVYLNRDCSVTISDYGF